MAGLSHEQISEARRWLIVGALVAVCIGLVAVVVLQSHSRRQASEPEAPPTTNTANTKGPKPRAFTAWTGKGARQTLLHERDAAMKSGNLLRVAEIHAQLSQEALISAARVGQAWMGLQDPDSKLFPQEPRAPYWTYENAGADCYGFLLDVGIQLRPQSLADLTATLDHEAQLAPPGELCRSVQIHTLEPMQQDEPRKMFTSSEYVKDGLLSVFERLGPSNPSAARMIQVLDIILAHSNHHSKYGIIPSPGQEENGNVIQACARLSYAYNRPDYAEMAARIADATIMQLLPAGKGLPMQEYDYENDKPISALVKIRDHGNEVFPGMGEAYALAVSHLSEPVWKERADRWAEPLATMYEQTFKYGRSREGLLISAIMAPSHRVRNTEPNDTWGYILDGVLAFTQAARMHGKLESSRIDALEALVDRTCKAAAAKRNFPWQGGIMDGSADSFESAMYMACYRPVLAPMLLSWLDDQIEQLYLFQRPDGFCDEGYLDGNYIRTVLMYADLRSGGWKVTPWRDDVSVGFVRSDKGQSLLLVKTEKPYAGTITPDPERHKEYLHLPWNWPRLNSWPEWFALKDSMKLTEAKGIAQTPSIADIRAGLKIDLPAKGALVLQFDSR